MNDNDDSYFILTNELSDSDGYGGATIDDNVDEDDDDDDFHKMNF